MRIKIEKITASGTIVSESIISEKPILKPTDISALGFNHSEQVELLSKIQDGLLSSQSELLFSERKPCPKCAGDMKKRGKGKSDFHSVFTDHKIPVQLFFCPSCSSTKVPSIHGLFGNSIHPDLAKLQAQFGSEHSFRKASSLLNSMAGKSRRINFHSGIKRMVETIGEHMAESEVDEIGIPKPEAAALCVQVDGGHLKTKDPESRSFEAITAVAFDPKQIEFTSKKGTGQYSRGTIKSKRCIGSALENNLPVLQNKLLAATKAEGLGEGTKIVVICDGAKNCWNVADVLNKKGSSLLKILDWFHISMRFQNSRLGAAALNEELSKAKWSLWHGNYEKSIQKIRVIQEQFLATDKRNAKLARLLTYLHNNADYLPDYSARKEAGEIYTSHMAESTVESLINQRCKGKQHMRWSRKGVHAILQIRAARASNIWDAVWPKIAADTLYKTAA